MKETGYKRPWHELVLEALWAPVLIPVFMLTFRMSFSETITVLLRSIHDTKRSP